MMIKEGIAISIMLKMSERELGHSVDMIHGSEYYNTYYDVTVQKIVRFR